MRPQTIRWTLEVPIYDTRPIVVIRGPKPLPEKAEELVRLISQATGEDGTYTDIELVVPEVTPKLDFEAVSDSPEEEQVVGEIRHQADLTKSVFRALNWAKAHYGNVLNRDHRVILVPHRDSVINSLVISGLSGILGIEPEVLNLVTIRGTQVPNPEMPLIRLGSFRKRVMTSLGYRSGYEAQQTGPLKLTGVVKNGQSNS